jgi:hypothetical protein
MTIFMITNKTTCFAVTEIYETDDFFILPKRDSSECDIYPKEIWRCEVKEAKQIKGT